VGVTPWPAPAKGIRETPDTFARGGGMEPAARTVASRPKWPMRAGGPGGWREQPPGTYGAAMAAQASDRPLQWGGGLVPACRRGHSRGQLGGPRGASRGVYTGGLGDGEGLSGSPCRQASGLSRPAGQVPVACACALVDLWVLRPPCPVRREAGLSRPCPRRWGSLRLAHTVGGGTGSGS